MAFDVTPVFTAYFARNRGPAANDPTQHVPPNYGVSARLDGSLVELDLTFRAGAGYCCYEWGCHLGMVQGKRWEWLRRELTARGLALPELLELRMSVTVEAGALFFDYDRPLPEHRGRYALSASKAVRYQAVVAEVDSKEAEPSAAPDGDERS